MAITSWRTVAIATLMIVDFILRISREPIRSGDPVSGRRERAAGSSSALLIPRNSRKKFRNLSRSYLLPDPVWIFSQSYFTRSPLPYARPGHGLMKLAEKNANKMRGHGECRHSAALFSLCRGAASSAFESAVRADKNIWERKLEVPSRLVNLFDNLSRGSWSDRVIIAKYFLQNFHANQIYFAVRIWSYLIFESDGGQ